MKTYITILLITIGCVIYGSVFITRSSAQRRAQAFSHNTKEHKTGRYADCSVCHQLPTPNWTSPRRHKEPSFPDVTTFPNPHRQGAGNVCFACHTDAAFSGGGVFCGTCHTVPSMRARAVLPFPVQGRARQFNIIFPHDVHQDLIAKNEKFPDVAVAHFVRASYSPTPVAAAEDPYSCAVCHETSSQMPRNRARTLTGLKPLGDVVADTFERPLTPAFFKDSPDGHASCFNCHYQYQYLPKGKQNCAGCHEMTSPYIERRTLERYSTKFDHTRTGHVENDCASCHVRITQNSQVKLMKDADVPISTCWRCHATQEEGKSRRVLLDEIAAREASISNKTAPFQCTYCHTSAVGRFEIPVSHKKP